MLRIICLVLLLGWLPATVFAEVKIIELKYRPGSELLEKVREVLDEGEKVTDAGNHLLLVADGESLNAATQLIKLLDRQLTMLVVRLQQAESSHILAQGASSSLSASNKNQLSGEVSTGRVLGNSTKHSEQMLRVLEGEGGWLEVGKDIPYTEEWAVFTGESSGYAERVNYKTIAVGFWVQVVKILPKSVLVDIEPRFSHLSGPQTDPPEISFSGSRTRLQLPFGQWQPLASSIHQNDRISRAIIHWRTDSGVSDEELFIRIDPEAEFSP